MKTVSIVCMMLFFNGKSQAQHLYIDSLMSVTNYLLDLKSAVNDTITPVTHKVNKLDSMVRLATKFQTIIDNSGKKVVVSGEMFSQLRRDYRFVIQSVILFKTDSKDFSYDARLAAVAELQYLNKYIPPLIHTILQQCALARQRLLIHTN